MCVHCPLQLAHQLFAEKGVAVVGIHHASVPADDVRAFCEQRGVTFPIGVDSPLGRTCDQYEITSLPTKVLLNRDGSIVEAGLGNGILETLRRLVLYDERDAGR